MSCATCVRFSAGEASASSSTPCTLLVKLGVPKLSDISSSFAASSAFRLKMSASPRWMLAANWPKRFLMRVSQICWAERERAPLSADRRSFADHSVSCWRRALESGSSSPSMLKVAETPRRLR
jgi:hypothetical protein